jgi:DNA invertase Pin-like site-specific DNA recombinase
MSELLVGCVRVSTDEQDRTAQRDALSALGIEAKRIYVDYGPKFSKTKDAEKGCESRIGRPAAVNLHGLSEVVCTRIRTDCSVVT